MDVFFQTADQMLILFFFIALGYLLGKKGILPKDADTVLSKLETNLFMPCLIFYSFYRYCTVDNFQEKWVYALYGLAITLISLAIGLILSPRFTRDSYQKKIYTYSFAVANFSFTGNAVILGMYGEAVLFDYMMLTLPMNLFVYSYGASSLIPGNSGKRFSLKSLVNPPFISLLAGAACGLLRLPLPSFVTGAASSGGACMAPAAMILTGLVVGSYNLKALAGDRRIYVMTVLRLVLMPGLFALVLKAMAVDDTILRCALCATAMPLGLNTVVFPAAYGGDTTTGAGMALVSNLAALVTIPMMFGLFL